jgi:ABC-2 type transport system permease protein
VLPTTYVFSAAREVLDGAPVPWADLGRGLVGALASVALAYWFIIRMLSTFRKRGYVTRFS